MPTITKTLGAPYGLREGRFVEWGVSVVYMNLYDIVFGATETYTAGGIDIRTPILSLNPNMQEIVAVAVVRSDVAGWVAHYDHATGRLRFYGQEPTNASSGVIALSEMPNGSTAIQGRTVRVLVFGV